jgi:hypothetical protein
VPEQARLEQPVPLPLLAVRKQPELLLEPLPLLEP